MGSDTRQCQHYDGDWKLPGHQPKDKLVVLVLFGEHKLHIGGDFAGFTVKIDSIIPKLTVQPKRLWKN